MKEITSQVGAVGTEHFVLQVDSEGVKVNFVQQVDDIMIASPEGDILISWDNQQFSDTNCMLLQQKDNMKELNVVRCTHFYIKAKEQGKVLTVYLTGQRN